MYCGDGAFAQFCMNFGRFLVGFVILLTRTNRWFYWDAALGGALWSVGNALGVPIIQCIGIGLGVSIWGSTNMLLGWASGHFGWWGVKVEIANRPSLEYLGVTFALISIVLFIFVKPKPQVQHQSQAVEESDADSPAQAERADKRSTSCQVANVSDEESMKTGFLPDHGRKGYDTLQPGLTQKLTLASTLGARRARVIGVSLAIVAGTLFGLCMDPAQHMMSYYSSLSEEEDVKYSPFGFDYVFSNNVGALMFSFVYLLAHEVLQWCGKMPIQKYFDPVVHEKMMVPAFAAGAIGACGSAAWFFANQNLGLIVSFPIIAAGPGVVSSLWGAFVFKEISGTKNFLILAAAFLCVISAGVCSSLSK
jgi:glucose uptake protein GlcU